MRKYSDNHNRISIKDYLECFKWLQYVVNKVPLPDISDWEVIYNFADKQKILGICDPSRSNVKMERDILMRWISVVQQIRNRSALLNQRTAKLYQILKEAGFRCCILKGQGNAMMYPDPLKRMPGDIDVWIDADEKTIYDYVKNQFPDAQDSFKHIKFPVFADVPIDVHSTPLKFRHPVYQSRLQKWIGENKEKQLEHTIRLIDTDVEIAVPTARFNVIYQLGHILTHLFDEGIGLRHLIDFFYVLKNLEGIEEAEKRQIRKEWQQLGMSRLASAIMWIEHEVLGLSENLLLTTPDKRLGRKILEDILEGGNFGKYSRRQENVGRGRIRKRVATLRRFFRLCPCFPEETFFRLVARTSLMIKSDWNK